MFKMLTAEDMEVVFDSFERKEHKKGDVLSHKGQTASHIGILRQGDISASSGEPLQERGGFAFYGVDSSGLQEVSTCHVSLTSGFLSENLQNSLGLASEVNTGVRRDRSMPESYLTFVDASSFFSAY